MKKTLSISKFAFLACVILFWSCNGNSTSRKSNKLTVGYLPIAVALPLLVANDEGYFRDQGFDVEMVRMASSNELANAATSGQVDVSVVATNVMLDIGFVSKKKHSLIITNPYTDQEGHIADYMLVKASSPISKLADLKGKKIGVFPGSVIKIFCTLILEKHGLKKDDYQLVELAPKDWTVALETGQIDALSALEPLASQIIQDKIGKPIVSGFYSQLMPNVPLSGHWISEDYVRQNNKERVDRIILAVDKAVDLINKNPQKAKEYLVKYANVREDVVDKVQLNLWVPEVLKLFLSRCLQAC